MIKPDWFGNKLESILSQWEIIQIFAWLKLVQS